MPGQPNKQLSFPVIEGGRTPLTERQRRAVSAFAEAVRGLPDGQVNVLIELIHEFRTDQYLERVRSFEIPTLKILADVLNGWELDGVYEFAQAWVSTLVSRDDGFDWANCSPQEKAEHRRRIGVEMERRGVPAPY